MTVPNPPTTDGPSDAVGAALGLQTIDAVAEVTGEPVSAAVAAVTAEKPIGQFADIRRRFFRNKLAMIGLVVAVILIFIAAAASWITPYNPFEQNLLNVLKPPSAAHWFGTDSLGRDYFSGIIYGTRIAMIVGIGTVLGALILGVSLGAIAGFKGGAWDAVISRVIDFFLAFPPLIGAILIIRIAGNGVVTVIVALIALTWTTTGRLMRGQMLAVREAEYVEAARSVGATNSRIVIRHILPNAIAPVFVYAFTSIGVSVVAMAGLSFLGIGVPADIPEWGRLINLATNQLQVPGKSYLWIAPAAAIAITTLAFAFVADGLRDALDPKLRGGN